MKSLFRFIINAFFTTASNIRANKQLFLVSVGTTAIAFSILSLFLAIFVSLNSTLDKLEGQVRLKVYLKDSVSREERDRIEQFANSIEIIESVEYLAKEDAWNSFKKEFANRLPILTDLDFNPLPSSYQIKFKQGQQYLDVLATAAEKFSALQGVESVDYGREWISRFQNFMMFMRIFLLTAGGLLALGLILIVSNTIKLSIYSRSDEIELMQMIGATPRFVKAPFLLEGVVQGLCGSALALLLLNLIQRYVDMQFGGAMESSFLGFRFHYLPGAYVCGVILLSLVVGLLGSLFSIFQFLSHDGDNEK